ncbi:MAG: hypothetical protein JWO83_3510 [Caulobacteraceae bacterium]|nr:hypothetical protein [Caulobacteraceae bacterium]
MPYSIQDGAVCVLSRFPCAAPRLHREGARGSRRCVRRSGANLSPRLTTLPPIADSQKSLASGRHWDEALNPGRVLGGGLGPKLAKTKGCLSKKIGVCMVSSLTTALRRRVERLLNNSYREEDINDIYLGLRSMPFGRQSFLEVANFVAHPDIRDRGPVTERAKDFFCFLRYRMPLLANLPDFSATGLEVVRALQANLRIVGPVALMAELGLREAVAHSILGRASKKIDKFEGGNLNRLTRGFSEPNAVHYSSSVTNAMAERGRPFLRWPSGTQDGGHGSGPTASRIGRAASARPTPFAPSLSCVFGAAWEMM